MGFHKQYKVVIVIVDVAVDVDAAVVGQFQQQGVAQIRKPFKFRIKINSFFFLSLLNMMSEMRKNMHGQP